MSFDIDIASVQQYTTNIQLLLQQKGSVLRNTVMTSSHTGKAAKAIEQIGTVTALRVTTRHEDTNLQSTKHMARWVYPRDYIWADLIDEEDKLRLLIDPTSSYAQNGAYAIGRAMDDEIIEAFFGKCKGGENGNEDLVFPDKQYVVDKDKAASTGMTVDKLREAKKLLRLAEVDMDNDPIYCAITAQQEQDLLRETQVTSMDFNNRPVLADGRLTSFMGIQFIPIQRLPLNGALRSCPVWAKSGMHLGIWNDINVSVDRRPDKRGSVQVMAKGTFGATRTLESKVVGVVCKE